MALAEVALSLAVPISPWGSPLPKACPPAQFALQEGPHLVVRNALSKTEAAGSPAVATRSGSIAGRVRVERLRDPRQPLEALARRVLERSALRSRVFDDALRAAFTFRVPEPRDDIADAFELCVACIPKDPVSMTQATNDAAELLGVGLPIGAPQNRPHAVVSLYAAAHHLAPGEMPGKLTVSKCPPGNGTVDAASYLFLEQLTRLIQLRVPRLAAIPAVFAAAFPHARLTALSGRGLSETESAALMLWLLVAHAWLPSLADARALL